MTRDWEAETREAMRHAAEPLALLAAEIGKEIETKAEELKALNASLREANAALARLVPQEKKEKPKSVLAAGNAARAERQFADKLAGTRRFLADYPVIGQDGFTPNSLSDELKGLKNGDYPKMSVAMAKRVVEVLRDEGLLVADRVVRGGGMQYKVVSS